MEHLTEQEIAQCADAIREGSYASLPLAVREHVANCDECANEIAMVVETANEIDTTQKKNGKVVKLWISVSGAIAATVALLIIGNNFINNPKDSSLSNQLATIDSISQKDSSFTAIQPKVQTENKEKTAKKTVVVRKEILAEYKPNKDLDKLTENFKQAYRGDDNIVVQTLSEINIPTVDSLKWINNNSVKLTVMILNNEGKNVQSIETQGNGIKIPTLKPGLYYWKLINEDFDLLFCGKITIK